MGLNEAKTAIFENRTALGIEFGSTRIKAVLVDGHTAWRRSGKVSRAVTRIWQKMFRKNMEWSLQA